MRLNKFELALANQIQDKGGMTLREFEEKYNKSTSSLKRYIANLNSHCPEDKQFIIEGERIINNMSYSDLISLIQSLTIHDYTPSQHERYLLIIVYSFFNSYVNLSSLYEQIETSMTTKKNDSKDLDSYLAAKGLVKKTVPKKGITIDGSESSYRVMMAHTISRFCDIDVNDGFKSRRANNPLENMLFHYFYQAIRPVCEEASGLLDRFLDEHSCKLSYPSKKFLLIYLNLALYRMGQGFIIEQLPAIRIQVESQSIFSNQRENQFVSYLIASFDFTIPPRDKVIDEALLASVKEFVDATLNSMVTHIYTYDDLLGEVYEYMKKSILTLHLREDFYDNKLDNTHQHVNRMYTILLEIIVQDTISIAEKSMQVTFTPSRVAGLTLIFRKYVMMNRVTGRNRKKIIIVTNSAIEKSNFFFELLRQSVDIELAGIININELHLLSGLHYHEVIVFSNRIKTLLNEIGIHCIRLNFYITSKDIDMLIEYGFSTNSRKINTMEFIDEVSGLSRDEMKNYLLKKYPNFFIPY